MGDVATRQWNKQAAKVKEQRGEEIDDLGNKLSELEAYRRSFEPKLAFDGNGKGEMKTFCNVDCCDTWEMDGDNTNARRAAIKAQKAKKGKQDGNRS